MKDKKPHKKMFKIKGDISVFFVLLIGLDLAFGIIFGIEREWTGSAVCLSTAALLFIIVMMLVMKSKKTHKKGVIIKGYVAIILVVLIGINIMFSYIFGSGRAWMEFAVCLSTTVLLLILIIPLIYSGDTYECPKCGHIFKANPYKVFFTNGILQTFDLDGEPMKYAKLKCPNCQTKDMCKRHCDK